MRNEVNDTTKMNMAAAKMLGLNGAVLMKGRVYKFPPFDLWIKSKAEFDIFTNPADFLAAQKELWRRGLSITSFINDYGEIEYFVWDEPNEDHFANTQEKTPERTLGAACVAVVEGE